MKDFDFDELDKAVNSLISGDMPKTDTTDNSENTLNIKQTLSVDEKPSFNEIEQTAQKASEEINNIPVSQVGTASTPQPGLSTKRNARFMDVVSPSPSRRFSSPQLGTVSRQGVTVQPSTEISEPVSKPEPAPETPQQPSTDISELVNDIKTNLSDYTNDTVSEDSAEGKVEDNKSEPDLVSQTENTSIENDANNEPSQPAESELSSDNSQTSDTEAGSPFLPDAQVEKRPLGAFSDDSSTENQSTEPNTSSVANMDKAVEDAKPENPESDQSNLPRELQEDLLSVESNSVGSETSQADTTSQNVVPPASMSIPMQYKEQPSSDNGQSSPIYDTENYSQPMAFQAKKKADLTWLWIILIIILVGGSIGAVIYFFSPFDLL